MPQPTIATLGIVGWIDATAAMHNGKDYARFDFCVEKGWPDSVIAKEFGVTERTIFSWRVLRSKLNDRAKR